MTTMKESARRVAQAVIDAREPDAGEVGTRRSIVIERISPQLDGGRYPVKRVVGDQLLVTADIVADGHDLLDAALLVRADDEEAWHEAPMRPIEDDRWSGHVELTRNRWHRYAVEAWRDGYGSWRQGLHKKVEAGVAVATEIEEGRLLIEDTLARAERAEAADDLRVLRSALATLRRARSEAGRVSALDTDEVLAAMRRHPDRSFASRSPELSLVVDRERARVGAWYELFPRSQGRDPKRPTATTFAEAEWRLAGHRRDGLRRRLPAADPPDRPDEPQGAQQRSRGHCRRSRLAVRHRLGRGRPRHRRPGARRHRRA